MSIGVWLVPVVLVGVAAILWASSWLENLTAPISYDPELQTLDTVDPEPLEADADAVAGAPATSGRSGAQARLPSIAVMNTGHLTVDQDTK
jgi:hypothetical protein